MLIQFSDGSGAPLYVNPQYVIAVREQKHFGRPGVASDTEYHDTLIVTTKHEFNVQDPLQDVVRELNRASLEMLRAQGTSGEGAGTAPAPGEEPG
jgi:hypothetical protein